LDLVDTVSDMYLLFIIHVSVSRPFIPAVNSQIKLLA